MKKMVMVALLVSLLMAAGQALSAEKVKIGHLAVVPSLPTYVAMEKGFFTEQGLQVELIPFQSGTDIIDALVAGRIDADCMSAITGNWFAAQTVPDRFKIFLVYAADSNVDNTMVVVVKKDSPLKDLKGLKGKKVGTFPGATSVALAKAIVRKKTDPNKVIFIHDGTIYGFLSRFIHHIRVPSPLLFISCPESMERHEMRKNLRVDCFIPSTIHIDDKIIYRGVVSDLSTGGCRITMNHEGGDQSAHLEPENKVVIAIEMLGIKPDRGILGIVKNLHHDAKKIHIGVEFSTSDPDVLSRIQEYIEHVLGVMR